MTLGYKNIDVKVVTPPMIPKDLQKDTNTLKNRGFIFDFIEECGHIYIQFSNFPLPAGVYNMDETDLLIFTTPDYPCASFDMFWTDQDLVLKDGTVPKQSDMIEIHLGKYWRRFSYHPYQDTQWNPAKDNVGRYVEYVQQRLRNGD